MHVSWERVDRCFVENEESFEWPGGVKEIQNGRQQYGGYSYIQSGFKVTSEFCAEKLIGKNKSHPRISLTNAHVRDWITRALTHEIFSKWTGVETYNLAILTDLLMRESFGSLLGEIEWRERRLWNDASEETCYIYILYCMTSSDYDRQHGTCRSKTYVEYHPDIQSSIWDNL